jgi:hypothetical protein
VALDVAPGHSRFLNQNAQDQVGLFLRFDWLAGQADSLDPLGSRVQENVDAEMFEDLLRVCQEALSSVSTIGAAFAVNSRLDR